MEENKLNVSISERLHHDNPRTLLLLLFYKKKLIAREFAGVVVKVMRQQAMLAANGMEALAKSLRKIFLEKKEAIQDDLHQRPGKKAQ